MERGPELSQEAEGQWTRDGNAHRAEFPYMHPLYHCHIAGPLPLTCIVKSKGSKKKKDNAC